MRVKLVIPTLSNPRIEFQSAQMMYTHYLFGLNLNICHFTMVQYVYSVIRKTEKAITVVIDHVAVVRCQGYCDCESQETLFKNEGQPQKHVLDTI